MNSAKIIKDIKSLKIQGAQNIALKAVDALELELDKPGNTSAGLEKTKKALIDARPTEPCLRNVIRYIFSSEQKGFLEKISDVRQYFNESEKKITGYGNKKIRKSSIIYTHCHSGTVVKILLKAKSKLKYVNNTETRPLYQGRLTATELAKHNVCVNHYIDSAMKEAIKESDAIFIGADAIISDNFIVNKIGTGIIGELAHKFEIPLYVCACAYKFDAESLAGFTEPIEMRSATEIWKNPPQNVKIHNKAFEFLPGKFITAIISELGVLSFDCFIEETTQKYPWML